MTGKELRRIRRRLGLTQQALGQRLGVSRNTITRYETGRRKIERLAEIAIRCIADHG